MVPSSPWWVRVLVPQEFCATNFLIIAQDGASLQIHAQVQWYSTLARVTWSRGGVAKAGAWDPKAVLYPQDSFPFREAG